MERWQKLTYDVVVNVLANLLAAAALYVLAALVGLAPKSPGLFMAALVVLGVGISLAFLAWSRSFAAWYAVSAILIVATAVTGLVAIP